MTMNIKEGFMNYVNYLIKKHQHLNAESLAKWYKLTQELKASKNRG